MRVVVMRLAEEEEEQRGVEVSLPRGGGKMRRRGGEEVEGGEEVAGDKKSFLREGESVEMVKG